MRPAVLRSMFVMAALVALCSVVVKDAVAQASTSPEPSQTSVVLTRLAPPIYPPMARQARITGDVKIHLLIRRDGGIESADVTGHQMLKESALESAQKSQFECRGCSEAVTSYSLTYTFEVEGDCRFGPNCLLVQPAAAEVTQSQGKVKISVEPTCTCDPVATKIRCRSPKCLYLWKCGFREVSGE